MEPFYFGDSRKSLLGMYHPPSSDKSREAGVILCHPLGQEYIRSHRALMRLSLLLSSAGFHVLRFDFYGCGDSLGNENDWDISRWQADIASAIEELREGAGVSRICLIGLRLGGSLALMAGAVRGDVDRLVLWDPIINGAKYVKELNELHQEWLRGSFAKRQASSSSENQIEVLGFPLTDSFSQSLAQMDLLSLPQKPGNDMLFIESSEETDSKEIRESLSNMGANVYHEFLPEPAVWEKKEDDIGKGLMPVQILQNIVAWIGGARA
jgi:exosortase A-associated hydrolase 2